MFEISLCITPAQHIAVEAILEELGAVSISLHDAKDEPVFVYEINETPLWKHITLAALFDDKINFESIQTTLEEVLACPIEISQRNISQQDWQNIWKQDFHPIHFGGRLWICPSWCTAIDPFAINIQLDPGIAFGTGTHPTTALCLEWLAQSPPIDKRVLDFGCGSGILAIAAYFLGAKTITAVDHDPQATQATCANIERNRLPNNAIKVDNTSVVEEISYDVIMANVLLKPLVQLEPQFTKAVDVAGKIILSGILQQQLEELEQHYTSHFSIDKVYSKKEWLLVEASRR